MPLQVTGVFVPGAYPQHTYIERTQQGFESTLRDALDTPGQIISLSGPSKSGKTVLVERVVGRDSLIAISGVSIRHPDITLRSGNLVRRATRSVPLASLILVGYKVGFLSTRKTELPHSGGT
jgi:hypothetical protein